VTEALNADFADAFGVAELTNEASAYIFIVGGFLVLLAVGVPVYITKRRWAAQAAAAEEQYLPTRSTPSLPGTPQIFSPSR
jgi:hypothetical protein